MPTIDKTIVCHLGDLFRKTNISILAAEIGSGAPVFDKIIKDYTLVLCEHPPKKGDNSI